MTPIQHFEKFMVVCECYGHPYSKEQIRGINRFMAWMRSENVEIAESICGKSAAEEMSGCFQDNGSVKSKVRKNRKRAGRKNTQRGR